MLNSKRSDCKQRILEADREWLAIDLNACARIDVADLEEAFDCIRGIPTSELTAEQSNRLDAVASLYRGDLLEGWYQDWCIYERARLQGIFLSVLDKLVSYCEWHEQSERAVEYAERILGRDPANEVTHQRLMRVRYAMGDRAGALRQYNLCCLALKQELGVGPSQQTVELVQEIRAQNLKVLNSNANPPQARMYGDHSRTVLLNRLEEAVTVITDLWQLLREEVVEPPLPKRKASQSERRHSQSSVA